MVKSKPGEINKVGESVSASGQKEAENAPVLGTELVGNIMLVLDKQGGVERSSVMDFSEQAITILQELSYATTIIPKPPLI